MRWLSTLKQPPKKVYVTHGEEQAAINFAEYLHEKTGYEAIVPHYQETVVLE